LVYETVKMGITNLSFTFCISTRKHGLDEIFKLISDPASRVSPSTPTRDDHRVFWEFNQSNAILFEDVWSSVVQKSIIYANTLIPISDADMSIWCSIHTDTEFAGLALEATQMKTLGEHGVALVISTYAS
jgi:hypothetical protein